MATSVYAGSPLSLTVTSVFRLILFAFLLRVEPFAHLCHTRVDPTMDKAKVLLNDIMRAPLHLNPIGTHVGFGAEKYATGLHVQAVHQPKSLRRILADKVVRGKVLLHPVLHL